MLAQEWVRKLMLRCGSRFGASRSEILSTPPRLGAWPKAWAGGSSSGKAASRATACTASRKRRPMASSFTRRSRSIVMERGRPGSVRTLCAAAGACQFASPVNPTRAAPPPSTMGASSGGTMPRTVLEPRFQVEYLSVLDAEGSLDSALDPGLPPAELKRLYRAMLLGRRLDERMVRLQRQGRIGTFAPIKGQEASQLGSVAVLRPTDWMVPSFRETAAMIWRGWPIEKLLLFFAGHLEGGQPAPDQRDLPITIPVSTQLPHAVGLAYAGQYREEAVLVMAYLGDGARSEADFHEAWNFAGGWHVPAVFVCQNNQWAISVPLKKQTNSKTIAQKALAYGLPGLQVDGNDVLAVYAATKEAVARARAGDGPTLIECVTYRLGVHTTADDPTKYRSAEEVAEWERRDPLTRFAAYLQKRNLLEEGLEAQVDAEIAEAIKRFEATPPADPLTMFDHVYGDLPPHLRAQRDEVAARLRAGGADGAETRPASPPMRGQRSGKR